MDLNLLNLFSSSLSIPYEIPNTGNPVLTPNNSHLLQLSSALDNSPTECYYFDFQQVNSQIFDNLINIDLTINYK